MNKIFCFIVLNVKSALMLNSAYNFFGRQQQAQSEEVAAKIHSYVYLNMFQRLVNVIIALSAHQK